MHSMRRFFALKSIRRQITHDKSSNKLLWICVSIALSSTAAIEALFVVSGSEIINGISWVWPLESVVMTVVVDVELVVAIICTGLELLESLDLFDDRLTDALITPLPVALLSSAIYFLLSVLMSILFGPCLSLITSSNAFRIFSAASVFEECKNFKACRNTGSNSTIAAIFSFNQIYSLSFTHTKTVLMNNHRVNKCCPQSKIYIQFPKSQTKWPKPYLAAKMNFFFLLLLLLFTFSLLLFLLWEGNGLQYINGSEDLFRASSSTFVKRLNRPLNIQFVITRNVSIAICGFDFAVLFRWKTKCHLRTASYIPLETSRHFVQRSTNCEVTNTRSLRNNRCWCCFFFFVFRRISMKENFTFKRSSFVFKSYSRSWFMKRKEWFQTAKNIFKLLTSL